MSEQQDLQLLEREAMRASARAAAVVVRATQKLVLHARVQTLLLLAIIVLLGYSVCK